MLGIVEGFIVVYDSDNFTTLGQINESKGVTQFSVHEPSSLLCTISKRKVSLFLWQGFGFILRREIQLPDTPKMSYCMENMIILGHKKYYDILETATYSTSKLLDFDKENKMVAIEVSYYL